MTDRSDGTGAGRPEPRSALKFPVLAALIVAGIVLFLGLGIWQVQRLHWKLDLIARVDARLAADPVAAPGPAEWDGVTAASAEYRRVAVQGHYLLNNETLVKAVTELGSGFWVLTPMATDDGWTVLVNRGFVPGDRRAAAERDMPEGEQSVTGLLRLTEPGGAFLRSNAPDEGRWYSRDVAAIAKAQSLGVVAPYFIDAASADPEATERAATSAAAFGTTTGTDAAAHLPVAGLTVVKFRNQHLQYALTWFALAAALAIAGAFVTRMELRSRREGRAD